VAKNFSLPFSACCVINNKDEIVEEQEDSLEKPIDSKGYHIRPVLVGKIKKRNWLLMLADTALSDSAGGHEHVN
jgi:hypothetical protein